MAELKFGITATAETSARTRVRARNFEIIVDEPPGLGGTDQAANPVEYVLAALAGCLNVMGHLIAEEMGFELRGLDIEMSGTINPARLFGRSDAERAGYKHVEIRLKPDCDADDATLERWLEAVQARCPVCDNLKYETPVDVGLERSDHVGSRG